MNRALVALLSAFDAFLQAAVGLAVVGATLTVLWTFGPDASWAALWPATAVIWQLGQFVPVGITLPEALVVQLGIDADAASFTLSLAPLALAAFTVIFGVRSGARAARAGAWLIGVCTALPIAAAIAAAISLTSRTAIATTDTVVAIAAPALLYTGAVLLGAVVAAWNAGDDGMIDRLRDRVEGMAAPWPAAWAAGIRGGAIAFAGVCGLGAIVAALALVGGGAEIVALFQAGGADPAGTIVLMIAQLAYLPTLIVWAIAWLAGPGFALGAGTSVSPSGTDVGVMPAIPVLGAIPELQSSWLLLVVLAPVAAGAFAGWVARSAIVRAESGLAPGRDPFAPRAVAAVLIAAVAAVGAALLCVAASGSIGPGALVRVGPQPGWVALAVGAEVLVGAMILLLSPRRRDA